MTTLTPYTGIRETYYSRGVQDQQGLHQEIPVLGADLKSTWVFVQGRRILHLVEPVIQYEYADRLQKDIVPQFDEIDLAKDKNLITYSLTNRLLVGEASYSDNKDETLLVRLTQSYDLDRTERNLSDLRLEWQFKLGRLFSADLDTFYNVYNRRFSSINTDATIHGSRFFNLSAGQRYTRQGDQAKKGDIFNALSLGQKIKQDQKIDFLTVGANIYIPWLLGGNDTDTGNGIYVASKGYYNLDTDGFHEIDYGVKYSAQCWEIVVDYLDFKEKNQINFLITLKGAVTVDSRSAGGLFEKKPSP